MALSDVTEKETTVPDAGTLWFSCRELREHIPIPEQQAVETAGTERLSDVAEVVQAVTLNLSVSTALLQWPVPFPIGTKEKGN